MFASCLICDARVKSVAWKFQEQFGSKAKEYQIIKDCIVMNAPHIRHGREGDMKEKSKSRKTSERVVYVQMNLTYLIFIIAMLNLVTEIHIAKIVKQTE